MTSISDQTVLILTPDIAGVLERDRSDRGNRSLPHRPVAARLLVDPLLADQE